MRANVNKNKAAHDEPRSRINQQRLRIHKQNDAIGVAKIDRKVDTAKTEACRARTGSSQAIANIDLP